MMRLPEPVFAALVETAVFWEANFGFFMAAIY